MAELDFTNIASTSIATPAAGVTAAFVDTDKRLKVKDDTGFIVTASDINNFSVASQAPTAATRTYITGSKITVPPGRLQIGTMFRWSFSMTKTAAGIAASTFDIAVGTNGTTADVARVSFTKPAGTAAIDEGFVTIIAVVRGPLSASGVISAEFVMFHNGNTVGHAIIPVVVLNIISAGFDVTVAGLFIGLCITSGAADVLTIQLVTAEAFNL